MAEDYQATPSNMDDAHPKMRFSLSPPPAKTISVANMRNIRTNDAATNKSEDELSAGTVDDAASDYKQWLHAMKLVARLPGGMPPEFRRKLWLTLAEKYLKSKNVDWVKEEEKCFCEKWREDDEELGIQIVKDLHRTGSNLCTGPAGDINQAKLKRILLGYARYNPEVGYCQGFNMLGALILQVMDKDEAESIKVMIYLIEGVLPPGYFCGSMGGLQADMGVFRELMTMKLPRLAKHLQKLQGPIEYAYEPPLTNVFTMQWFLTMFCTCLPMSCVLRVWDLVLIEGSDVLLRTALVLWSLLEERILSTRTADDFYCKMGSFSSELLNGHLIDSNGLVEKVVQLGPITDIQCLRDKHLYNIAPLRHKQGLQLYFDDEEPESDEDSRLAVATVWGIPWGRRGSGGQASGNKTLPSESKDRLALDISLLKKQYDRLRERQKQAHIILTSACSTAARQSVTHTNPTLPVNQLLMGRSAIVTNKGKRVGPPPGAIPPARKPSLPAILTKPSKTPEKQLRRGETLHWRDTDISKRRRDSLTWKEIKADRLALASHASSEDLQPRKIRTRMGKSDSSSYSEESDGESASSTDTSLCDEDDVVVGKEKTKSKEKSPKRRAKMSRKQKELNMKLEETKSAEVAPTERKRPKSWASTNDEIPFMLMSNDSPTKEGNYPQRLYDSLTIREDEDSTTECDRAGYKLGVDYGWSDTKYSRIAGDLATTKVGPLHIQTDVLELPVITGTAQLSPIPNITNYLDSSVISSIPNVPESLFLDSINSLGSGDGEDAKNFDVNEDGVTNEYFERVNNVERPTQLDLFYSLSEEDSIRNAYEVTREKEEENPTQRKEEDEDEGNSVTEIGQPEFTENSEEGKQHETTKELEEKPNNGTHINEEKEQLYLDHPERPTSDNEEEIIESESPDRSDGRNGNHNSALSEREGPIEKAEGPIAKSEQTTGSVYRKYSFNESNNKRRDPRRLTITRSLTIDSENKEFRTNSDSETHFNEPEEPPKKAVPSTEELEERFKKFEKQLSASKSTRENSLKSNLSLESPSSPNSRSLTESDCTNIKRDRYQSRIPSTVELEDRFNNLERQKLEENENRIEDENVNEENTQAKANSENVGELKTVANKEEKSERTSERVKSQFDESLTKKPLPDLEENNLSKKSSSTSEPVISLSTQSSSSKETISRSDKTSQNNESSTNKTSENEKEHRANEKISNKNRVTKVDTQNISSEVTKDKLLEESKSSGANLPTTAQLEDRYNALERKRSGHKDTVSKNEKEPPDEIAKTRNEEHSSPTDRDNDIKRKNSETRQTKSNAASKPKRLPSTEELEKRFEALEKALSTENVANIEQEDNKNKKGAKNREVTAETNRSNKVQNTSKESPLSADDPNESSITDTPTARSDPEIKSENELERNESKQLAAKRFQDQCKIVNDQFDEKEKAAKSPTTDEDLKPKHKDSEKESQDDGARSASEPPTTEGLEQRFEAIQRRMSPKSISKEGTNTRTVAEKSKGKVETNARNKRQETSVGPATSRRETVISPRKVLDTEHTSNGATAEISSTGNVRRASEPPTTEELEKRYEDLKRRMSAKASTLTESSEEKEHRKVQEEKLILESNKVANKKLDKTKTTDDSSQQTNEIISDKVASKQLDKTKTTEESSQQTKETISRNEDHVVKQGGNDGPPLQKTERPAIPVPPPMQNKPHKILDSLEQSKHKALVEELRSKMRPNDQNIKPSDINPTRKLTIQRRHLIDETSEAHAAALRRLKKDESWHVSRPHKMVRRFSDIPSRADLENRVNFLEHQLGMKLLKQRSASDSEVTSRIRFKEFADDNNEPRTSSGISHDANIENRVNALEKKLSENSLKLLETIENKSKTGGDQGHNNQPTDTDSQTGMELVRYTHYGEIEESEANRPINISINIKMHLNKDNGGKRKTTATSSKTEDMEKRLKALEEQLLKSRQPRSEEVAIIFQTNGKTENNESLTDKADSGNPALENIEPPLGEEIPTEVVKNHEESKEDNKESKANQGTPDQIQSVIKEQPVAELRHTLANEVNLTEEDNQIKPQTTSGFVSLKDQNQQSNTINEKTPTTSGIENNNSKKDKPEKSMEKSPAFPEIKSDIPMHTSKADTREKRLEEETSHGELQSETGAEKDSDINVKVNNQQNHLDVASEERGADDLPIDENQTKKHLPASVEKISSKVQSSPSTQNIGKPEDAERLAQSESTRIINADSKNMVLLLDNEPKPVKVRRLTRANTEELEDLLQALEKQMNQRNLIKSDSGKLIRVDSSQKTDENPKQAQAISDLSKEIQEFTSTEQTDKQPQVKSDPPKQNQDDTVTGQNSKLEKSPGNKEVEDKFDWGPDPVKRHLKRSTVHLPSTKELVARYRSLERQIRLLEDVEKIDVEQRLNEIERKIKLQYSLSHEKDLFKFLELCDGKLPDDDHPATPSKKGTEKISSTHTSPSRSRSREKSPYITPSHTREGSPYTSPSPSRRTKRSPYDSPVHHRDDDDLLPTTEDLEYRYRVLDLVRSKSKDGVSTKAKRKSALKRQPIHPLEMLLDPSPVESDIPTTGELEHRIRVLEDKHETPSPPRRSLHRSPTIEDLKREKMIEDRKPKAPIHNLETLVSSPTKRGPPTEQELEARMRALEEEQKFDFKMQKNYKEFNQKLRDVISPSLSFEEFKAAKSREQSPKRPQTPKSAIKDYDIEPRYHDNVVLRTTSPRAIRFQDEEYRRPKSSAGMLESNKMVGTADVLKTIEENSKSIQRILKKTLADSNSSSLSDTTHEGLAGPGLRLMRETSPLRRTGTHTGVPLRTDDNINDRLNSIKNTIKSIDSLCEEKPYRMGKCQRYIDSLFNESVYFGTPSQKSSLEDLSSKRKSGEYAPSIHVSEHCQRPSEEYLSRSVGSAESIRSGSPLRAASPLHHRSTRDLRRDNSPRRRYGDEEREEYESRVRTRVNLLPNCYLDDSSESLGRSSLTKFHKKVDNEIDIYKFDDKARSSSRSVSRSPLRSPYGLRETMNPDIMESITLNNTNANTPLTRSTIAPPPTTTTTTTLPLITSSKSFQLEGAAGYTRPIFGNPLGCDSSIIMRSTAPAYTPSKLEIRHTTVTSTFYDRLLTEKQIEKSLSHLQNKSPMVSPSATSKSYLPLGSVGPNLNPKSNGNSPTPTERGIGATSNSTTSNVANMTCIPQSSSFSSLGTTAILSTPYNSRLPPLANYSHATIVPSGTALSPKMGSNILTSTISNIATHPTIVTTTISTTTSTSLTNTFSHSTRLPNTTFDLSQTTTGTITSGTYNPLLSLNLKAPSETGIQLDRYQLFNTSTNQLTGHNMNLPKS